MAKQKMYQSRAVQFYEDKRGFYYLRTVEGEDFNEEDAASIAVWMADETKQERKPLLIELAYGSTISHGVQSFLAEKVNRISTADAILISSFAHKLMATFYLRHYKPEVPTRVFSDIFDALKWIESKKKTEEK